MGLHPCNSASLHDMIVGYDFMIETDSGVLPAQASMTLYQDDQLTWLSSPEHHVKCQWIHPERNQLEVAALVKKVPTRTDPRCAPSACYPC